MIAVTKLHYAKSRRELEIQFSDGTSGSLSAEFLRVHSPSAEVRGHGPGQETLQSGKAEVTITQIDAVGHYAVQLFFSDGHDSGIFSWQLLHRYVLDKSALWESYLSAIKSAGLSRDPEVQGVRIIN